jgi:hypothetical protein
MNSTTPTIAMIEGILSVSFFSFLAIKTVMTIIIAIIEKTGPMSGNSALSTQIVLLRLGLNPGFVQDGTHRPSSKRNGTMHSKQLGPSMVPHFLQFGPQSIHSRELMSGAVYIGHSSKQLPL